MIGLGGIAQSVHLPLIQRNRADVDLVAVVELSASRLATLADRYGVSGRFTSLDALLAAVSDGSVQIDAAIVATGGGHTDEVLALIRAGVRVLVEKPLGWSGQDLDTLERGLADLGRDPHDWLRIGYMKEYDPAVAAARTLLADVTPREVRVEVLHPADGAQIGFARLEPAAGDIDAAALDALTTRAPGRSPRRPAPTTTRCASCGATSSSAPSSTTSLSPGTSASAWTGSSTPAGRATGSPAPCSGWASPRAVCPGTWAGISSPTTRIPRDRHRPPRKGNRPTRVRDALHPQRAHRASGVRRRRPVEQPGKHAHLAPGGGVRA
ncbi:Gfo/Idh/MocA family oxidoreductase [Tessaracoccus sp. HDW20]|uniref:Gfo/Idh/MocA family protein n=1 Tax=Tessaracoccus coleopterorum TaxID=2714950 RepID=UPI0018D3D9AB|nr:Gfo/Idh/MocA family oxidoreductase [Tessaracoccus coleopterorum]